MGLVAPILSITFASDLVLQIYQLMWALAGNAIPGSTYWWMVTGADTMNTGITKTNSLFQEKQSGDWHGPLRELMGMGFRMTGLLWFLDRCWAIEHPCCHGCALYTETGSQWSHLQCHHTAHEIWPNAFYITSRVMHVFDNIKSHAPGPYPQTIHFTGV